MSRWKRQELYQERNEREQGGNKGEDRAWAEKMKRADFNKPKEWGDNEKYYPF